MILQHNGHSIKLIPEKYLVIENITDYLDNEHQRRLTNTERFNLDQALFVHYANDFIQRLSEADKLVFEQVKDADPVACVCLKNGLGDTQYALRLSNGIKVLCHPRLFELATTKEYQTYASALPTIAITNDQAIQLTLFDE